MSTRCEIHTDRFMYSFKTYFIDPNTTSQKVLSLLVVPPKRFTKVVSS